MTVIEDYIKKYGSQQKAGKQLGVSQTAVWNWLNGKSRPRLEVARMIAKEMKVSLEKVYE
ncbi:helix-turn-helix domain-containing protein [Wohlfahrtiimonas chitiniclastica]|uniref:helix-turn-helix domain-containing protein n=1 Tax=Wohlfahrtiimonas chitiniclastica TaxID=400946 RepID=UPI001BCE5697|nr:helix-turn-helix transcriptional regulator [Wohlfahrtiimonas chitiniclastica]MBS7829226.1 helix-turn-helix transcriptional regulator [Wohlfahrtiimonas chitiniclastica]MBS7836464.1 helix-turn-helix transcriptional regulator [Wohlfahrtiimonas chitiniclastica]